MTEKVKRALKMFEAQERQELDWCYEGGSKDVRFVATTLARYLKEIPDGFTWIDKRVRVRGEDFEYEAQCICSFPKASGKVRYIVEDRGRIFIQREEQLTFL